MNNYLLIGDLHVTKANLEESRKFILWIAELCKEKNLIPIFMGDQYNDHGIVRVEVLTFWNWAYDLLGQGGLRSISLTGNHDMNHECTDSAMVANAHQTDVYGVDGVNSQHVFGEVYALPYIKKNEDFVASANALAAAGAKYILCHQECDGSQYESGMYSPNGVKLELLPKGVKFISGHIHLRQLIGKMFFYLGTPRQLTRSDCGAIKGVHIWDGKTGFEFIETPENVCERFQKIVIKAGEAWEMPANSSKIYIDVCGPKEFVKSVCSQLPPLVKVKPIYEREKTEFDVKESEGISIAFGKYVDKYCRDKQLDVAIQKEILERVYSRCPSLRSA